MRKSLLKQIALIAILGPFGLFYTNVIAALVLVLATILAIYSAADPLSLGHLMVVLPTALIVSLAVGSYLVTRHNRQLTKNFQLSSYYGNVSCKMVRKDSVDQDYHQVLNKVRRKKTLQKAQIVCLSSLCIGYSALILKPYIEHTIPIAGKTAGIQAPVHEPVLSAATPANSTSTIRKWKNKQDGTTVITELKALDYTSSSDGPYLPVIQLSCKDNSVAASFNVRETLGNNSPSISIKIDNKPAFVEKWKLDPGYQSAITRSTATFMKQLKKARTITIGYSPFGTTSEKTARFDLTGSTVAINAFQLRCAEFQSNASI